LLHAGAATSLKYANLRNLPSSPSLGLPSGLSSAGAAAGLASSSHKPTSRWKVDPSASAFSAAVLAKDFKLAEPWQPEPSAHGAKAALLAHSRSEVEISPSGNSTSSQNLVPSQGPKPQPDHDHTTLGKIRPLRAATGAMAAKRQRSGSAPTLTNTWPDSEYSAANALNAAAIAHSPSIKRAAVPAHGLQSINKTNTMSLDISRIHSAARDNVTRALTNTYAISTQESTGRDRVDVRAATISMARQFITVQPSSISDAEELGAYESRLVNCARPPSNSPAYAGGQAPVHFNSLEHAADQIASERLARLHIEHEAYRRMNQTRAIPLIQGRARRRATSVGQCTAQDEEQSRKIRSEMSLLTSKVARIDAKKGERDCTALVAVANKNVQACMHKMDEEILSYTGRLTPSTQWEWEAKAIAAAEAESKVRMSSYGKIDIGGGKFIDQEEVDAAAAKKVRPLLDELNEKAEKERAKHEQTKWEEQGRRRITKEDLLRERDLKAAREKTKGEYFASHMSRRTDLRQLSKLWRIDRGEQSKNVYAKRKDNQRELPRN
jgi:hypothetical protein